MTPAQAETAASIRTAQSIAHHRLYELDHAVIDLGHQDREPDHQGPPAECTRPLCVRLLQDADAVEALTCS